MAFATVEYAGGYRLVTAAAATTYFGAVAMAGVATLTATTVGVVTGTVTMDGVAGMSISGGLASGFAFGARIGPLLIGRAS